MREPLEVRRKLLEETVLSKLSDPVRQSPVLDGPISAVVQAVREQRLEGLIAKRRDSVYEPGQRSGAWRKMRVNQGQEFVIGGFTPHSREQLFQRLRKLQVSKCPFDNLPEAKSGRWGEGLTAAKMAECRWLKPVLVGHFEFVEWTPDKVCTSYRTSS
jgi:ATP-dependent DNA ligase